MDFPQQTSPTGGFLPTGYGSAFANKTHTEFSRSLVNFLLKDLQLPQSSEYRSFAEPLGQIDFSSSSKVRLVHSLAGTFETDEDIEKAGGEFSLCTPSTKFRWLTSPSSGAGLVSLAQAVRELKTFENGTWKVEYAVRDLP